MRLGRDNCLLFEDGKFFGVCLGADYCAEHEWGIDDIKRAFGMVAERAYGVDRRKIRLASPMVTWFSGTRKIRNPKTGRKKEVTVEGFYVKRHENSTPTYLLDEFHFTDEQTLCTGWSGSDFGAFSTNHEEINRLRQIYEAFSSLDIAIWLGGGGVFENSGLMIGIVSLLPERAATIWDTADREREKLLEDAAATGIEAKLRAAGKRWFALSPRRAKDGSVRFYLNPCDQQNNNYGVMTVKDLEDWIEGKGRIPIHG